MGKYIHWISVLIFQLSVFSATPTLQDAIRMYHADSLDEAKIILEDLIPHFERTSNLRYIQKASLYLGEIYYARGAFNAALELFYQANTFLIKK